MICPSSRQDIVALVNEFSLSFHAIFEHFAWQNKQLLRFEAFLDFAEQYWYFTKEKINILSKHQLGQIFVFVSKTHAKVSQTSVVHKIDVGLFLIRVQECPASIVFEEFLLCISLCSFCAGELRTDS